MIRIGLTGGIGTGKSTVSTILKNEGFKVIDADAVSKELLEKKPEILEKVRIQFGEGFFDWRGEFRRREFGNHIFRFPKQRIKYEQIIMPYIKAEIEKEMKSYEKKGEKIVIIDAPTLIYLYFSLFEFVWNYLYTQVLHNPFLHENYFQLK